MFWKRLCEKIRRLFSTRKLASASSTKDTTMTIESRQLLNAASSELVGTMPNTRAAIRSLANNIQGFSSFDAVSPQVAAFGTTGVSIQRTAPVGEYKVTFPGASFISNNSRTIWLSSLDNPPYGLTINCSPSSDTELQVVISSAPGVPADCNFTILTLNRF